MIVFARTKLGTDESAEKLAARGFSAAAINGDVDQKMRERTIQRLKDGQVDILVATDVAARGLDVDRISDVLNYDIPYDTESYVHRHRPHRPCRPQGRGDPVRGPRERGMLGAIERATRQKIEQMNLPSVDAVNENRVAKFLGKIEGALPAPTCLCSATWSSATSARRTCPRWRSPLHWRSCCKARRRCCWSSRRARSAHSNRARHAMPGPSATMVRVIKASARNGTMPSARRVSRVRREVGVPDVSNRRRPPAWCAAGEHRRRDRQRSGPGGALHRSYRHPR